MTFTRTSVLRVFTLLGILSFGVVPAESYVDENPYAEGRAAKCNTLADKRSLLPVKSGIFENDMTRALMDNRNETTLGALWASTSALRERSLHLRTHEDRFYEDSSQISAQFFIDALTDRTRVFPNMFNPEWIKSHIPAVLNDPDLLKELEKISFVQENIGFMLHAHHMYRRVGLSLDLPLHFSITHPWAPTSTRSKLAGDGSAEGDALISDQDAAELKRRIEKIEYKGGIGDLKVGLNFIQPLLGERVIGTGGLEVVIPLQSAKSPQKSLSFNPVEEAFNPTIFEMPFDPELAAKYAFRMIEYLKAIGESPVLGQKSFSIGVFGGIKIFVHPSCTLHQLLQVQYNLPVREYRIIHRYLSDDRIASNLAVEPGEFLVSSSRGLIVRGSAGIRQKVLKNVTLGLFGDVFWQNNENFRAVFTDDENRGRLLENYAEMERAKQVAIRFSIEKKFRWSKISCSDMRIALDAGFPLSSSGIGKMWHVGLQATGNF